MEGSSGPNTAPTDGVSMAPETFAGTDSDPLASCFSDWDPNIPPKVLITTSPKATKVTYNFCEEPADIFPGLNLLEGRRDEGSRWVGLWGGPWTEDIRRCWS